MKIRSFGIAVLLGSILAMHSAHAESTSDQRNSQNELYVSLGFGSIQGLALAFGDALGVALAGNTEVLSARLIGPLAIGYGRYLTPRWTIGLMFNVLHYTSTSTSTVGPTAGSDVRRTQGDIFTLMARTNIRWVNRHHAQLYSGLAFGGVYASLYDVVPDSTRHSTLTGWAAQIDLLGLRVGHDIGAFVELGFGFNGLVAGGISGKF